MLKVLIECENHSDIFDLPYNREELEQYLCDAGFWNPSADLCLVDDHNPENVQVKLIAADAIDSHLELLFEQDVRLSTINTVCDLFYRLPIEQQIDLTHKMADNHINSEKDLLGAIKEIKSAEQKNPPTIVFSRVKLWSQSGEEAEFFMSGIPDGYDDMEDHEECIDFKEFLEQNPDAVIEGITAHVTSFSEGNGESQPASESDIERIYTAVAEVDLDTITGWDKIGESTIFFDYEYDEEKNMDFSVLLTKSIMPEVESGSDKPMIVWRENNGWKVDNADNENVIAGIREKDPSALIVTGADFAKGSYPYVYDKILAMRLRAEYNDVPSHIECREEMAKIVDMLEDNMGELSSEAAEHLASLNNPLAKIYGYISSNQKDVNSDDVFDLIEDMRNADEQPGMSGIE